LQLFADLLPEAPAQALEAELEWLADALGPARDLDVFADEVLEPARRAVPDPAVLDILLQRAERKRRRAYRLVAEALGSARYGALTLEILRWRSLEVWRQDRPADSLAALDEPLGRLAGRLLDRLQGRVLKRGKGFARLDAAGRHRVRIALKKLRYAVEFFGDLYSGSRCRGYLKRLKRLQDDLGRANDVATAASLLDAVAGRSPTAPLARAVGAISGWHRRGVAELEPKLLKDWRSFAAAAPFWR
jgi:CHAD domain-containing protein